MWWRLSIEAGYISYLWSNLRWTMWKCKVCASKYMWMLYKLRTTIRCTEPKRLLADLYIEMRKICHLCRRTFRSWTSLVHLQENGTCIAPNICQCNDGYFFEKNSKNVCKPFCENSCQNGFCVESNTCACYDGYKVIDDRRPHVCAPICSQGCVRRSASIFFWFVNSVVFSRRMAYAVHQINANAGEAIIWWTTARLDEIRVNQFATNQSTADVLMELASLQACANAALASSWATRINSNVLFLGIKDTAHSFGSSWSYSSSPLQFFWWSMSCSLMISAWRKNIRLLYWKVWKILIAENSCIFYILKNTWTISLVLLVSYPFKMSK